MTQPPPDDRQQLNADSRVTVKSVRLEPHTFYYFDSRDHLKGRAVWTVTYRGRTRRIVTTLERGKQERNGRA